MDNRILSLGQFLNLLAQHQMSRGKIADALAVSDAHFSRICNNKARNPNLHTRLEDFVSKLNQFRIDLAISDTELIDFYQETADLAAATPYLSDMDLKTITDAAHEQKGNNEPITTAGFTGFLKTVLDISLRYPNELEGILKKQQEHDAQTDHQMKSKSSWWFYELPSEQPIEYKRPENHRILPGGNYQIANTKEYLETNLSIVFEISEQSPGANNIAEAYKDAYSSRMDFYKDLLRILNENSGLGKSTSDSVAISQFGANYYPKHPYELLNKIGLAKIKYHPLLDFYKSNNQQYYKSSDFHWYNVDAPEWIPSELRANIDSYTANELPMVYKDLQENLQTNQDLLFRQRLDRIYYKEDQFHAHISKMNYLHNNIYMGLNEHNLYFHNKYVLSRFPDKMELLTHQYPCAMNGCGLILQTIDNYLVFTFRPENIAGNQLPSRFSYACNGSCRYHEPEAVSAADNKTKKVYPSTNPFDSIRNEAKEELNLDLKSDELKLMGLGIDLERFYIQWSFFAQTSLTAKEICEARDEGFDGLGDEDKFKKNHGKQLFFVPYNINSIAMLLERFNWEPACEYSLMQFTHMKSMREDWRADAKIALADQLFAKEAKSLG